MLGSISSGRKAAVAIPVSVTMRMAEPTRPPPNAIEASLP